jgi:hypothetical protein
MTKNIKGLRLHRETVRELGSRDLTGAAGGLTLVLPYTHPGGIVCDFVDGVAAAAFAFVAGEEAYVNGVASAQICASR